MATDVVTRDVNLEVGRPDAGRPALRPLQEYGGTSDRGTLLLCPAVRVFAPSTHGVVLLARPVPGRRDAPFLAPTPAPCAPRQTGSQEGGGNAVFALAFQDCLSGIREVTPPAAWTKRRTNEGAPPEEDVRPLGRRQA